MSKFRKLALIPLLLTAAPAWAEPLGLGREALPEEIAAWDVDVLPDGRGLPDGSGSVADGEILFSESCAACHGEFAEGVDNWPKLAGGDGTLDRADPVKTVGSYWPYLSTVWDYVHRSMPFGQAQTLTADETYAITAYILYSNYLVEDDFVLTKENFTEIEMPNVDGFIIDDREETELPLFSKEPCMENCKDSVEITMRAAVLDVTPDTVEDNAPTPDAAPEAAPAEAAPAEPAEPAEAVEPVDATEPADEAAAPAEAAPETASAETPDPELIAAGEKVFNKCKACHQVGEGAKNRVGPVLNGIIGRGAGQVEGFKYSKAMTEAGADGLVWDDEAMHGYLADPKGFVLKNSMSFAGLKKPQDIDAVIAYLQSFP